MQASQLSVERYSQSQGEPYRHIPHFTLHGQIVKSCAGCARVRPIEDFPENWSSWDKLSPRCYDCHEAKHPQVPAGRAAC